MNFRNIFVIHLVLFLCGCTISGPIFLKPDSTPKDKSVVFIYKKKGFVGSIGCSDIYENNSFIGCLPTGGYLKAELLPGERVFSVRYRGGPEANEDFLSFMLEVEAGKIYYIKYTTTLFYADKGENGDKRTDFSFLFTGLLPFSSALAVIPEEQALQEIGNLRGATK